MKRLLLDVDGVIVDFIGTYLELVHEVTGCPYSRSEITKWSCEESLGLSEEVAAEVNQLLCAPGVVLGMEPYPGAVEAVKRLSQRFEIYFVTSHFKDSPTWAHDRETWLRGYFGDELGRCVVHTHHKGLISGDALLDDKPSHVLDWFLTQNGLAMLWDQPYNNGLDHDHMDSYRVISWEEVERRLEQLP